MPLRRSSLFKRSDAAMSQAKRRSSVKSMGRSARSMVLSSRRADPHPAPSSRSINDKTIKSATFATTSYIPTDSLAAQGYLMDVVARGTSDTERIGSKWNPVALHIRGSGFVTTPNTQVIQGYYVVWDAQPNQGTAVMNDVFIGTDAINSYAAASANERFTVLANKKWTNVTSTGFNTENSIKIVDDYIKIPKHMVCHATIGGTIGGAVTRTSGALLMFPYSNQPTTSPQIPSLELSHRIYFEDC